jgi:hypothetical protein
MVRVLSNIVASYLLLRYYEGIPEMQGVMNINLSKILDNGLHKLPLIAHFGLW